LAEGVQHCPGRRRDQARKIHGSSDATGAEPDSDPLSVRKYVGHDLPLPGDQPEKKLLAPGGRPIDIVRGGKVVEDLLA